jgi:drug/metabolite transporter (DMT)-like permease
MSIFFALLCGLSYGINNIWTNRVPSELSGKLVFYRSFLVFLINCVLTFVLWKVSPNVFPVNFDLVAIVQNFFLASFLFVGLVYLFKGLEAGPVSIVGSLIGSTGIISAFLASFLYGENLSPFKIFGILLGIFCLFLISVDFRNINNLFKQKNGIIYGIITFFIFGIGFAFTRPLIITLGPILFSTIVELTNSFWAIIYLYFTNQNIFKSNEKINLNTPVNVYQKNFGYLLISAGLIVVAGLSQNFALIFGEVSLVEPIIRSTITFFSVVLSVIFLKERLKFLEVLGLIGLIVSLVMIGV